MRSFSLFFLSCALFGLAVWAYFCVHPHLLAPVLPFFMPIASTIGVVCGLTIPKARRGCVLAGSISPFLTYLVFQIGTPHIVQHWLITAGILSDSFMVAIVLPVAMSCGLVSSFLVGRFQHQKRATTGQTACNLSTPRALLWALGYVAMSFFASSAVMLLVKVLYVNTMVVVCSVAIFRLSDQTWPLLAFAVGVQSMLFVCESGFMSWCGDGVVSFWSACGAFDAPKEVRYLIAFSLPVSIVFGMSLRTLLMTYATVSQQADCD